MRSLPDRSRSCLSLCDVAYSYTIFGPVHLPDSDLSCSFLSAGIGYHTTSFASASGSHKPFAPPPVYSQAYKGKSPFRMTLTDAMKKEVIAAAIQGGRLARLGASGLESGL